MRLFVLALFAGLMLAPTSLADEVKAVPNIHFESPYHLFHTGKIKDFRAWTGKDGSILIRFSLKGAPGDASNRLLIVLYDRAGNYIHSFTSEQVHKWYPDYQFRLSKQDTFNDMSLEAVYQLNLMLTSNTAIVGLAYYLPLSGR